MQIEFFRLVSDPATNVLLLAAIIFGVLLVPSIYKWRGRQLSIRMVLMTVGYAVFSFGLGLVLTFTDAPSGIGSPISDVAAAGGIITIVGLVVILGAWCGGGSIVDSDVPKSRKDTVRIMTIEDVAERAARKGLLIQKDLEPEQVTTPLVKCPLCQKIFVVKPEMLVEGTLRCTNCRKVVQL